MHWLFSNLPLISTLASVATLLVWVFYAHLLYATFRRNERPLILIHQARSGGFGSFCLVANLSRQPLHVVTVDLVVRTQGGHETTLHLNDYQRITGSNESEWAAETVMKEGPLNPGDFLALGGFEGMLDATRTEDDDADEEKRAQQYRRLAERTEELEIRVIALFSAYENPIGAVRRFAVTTHDGTAHLDPLTPVTRQLNSFRQRRRIYGTLQRAKDSQRRPSSS